MPGTATTTTHSGYSGAVPISVPVKASETATPKVNSRSVIFDDFDKCVIRRKIQEFYTVRKQLPTIDKLLAVLRDDICFKGSRETQRKIVRAIGFRKVTCQPDRNALIEKDRIVNLRARRNTGNLNASTGGRYYWQDAGYCVAKSLKFENLQVFMHDEIERHSLSKV